jgi:type VI secretion system protein ImpK
MTEFDDPFKSPESTVLRPRPGAGRRGPSDAPGLRQPAAAPPVEAVSAGAIESLGVGLNPLVRAASPLLLLTGQLRGTLTGPDVSTLRRHALDEIRRFEDRARASGFQNEVILAARYVLCAGLDEAVLSTPWGAQSEWAQQSLLIALHREAYGGEKFFEMLDRISSDPKRHIDLMELQYLCLAFGFAGKYHVADRGHSKLSDVQNALYRRIREYRGAPDNALSLHWKGLEDRRNPLIRYVPWWVVGAAALVIVAITYTTFYALLARAGSPVQEALESVRSTRVVARAAPTGGPTLRELLAPEIQRGDVSVERTPEGALVTLLRYDQFESGRAQFNRAHEPTLRAIGAALSKVPGRVEVIGHTDDQAVRPGEFANNFQLSRARATSVMKLLQGFVDSPPGRFEAVGKGESTLFKPDDPDYRKKNRRIAILLLGGS